MFTTRPNRLPRCIAIGLAAALWPLLAATKDEPVRVTFAHGLSDFTGQVPYGEARVAVDPAADEVLVGWGRDVRVFNAVGMQVHKFSTSMDNAGILDLVVMPEGDLFTAALALDSPGDQPRVVITRHDFRGVPAGTLTLTGATAPFTALLPNRLFQHDRRLVLVDTARWLAVFVERDGRIVRGLDLGAALGIAAEERESQRISGVALDSAGNFLLTCATLFRAFVISPEGAVLATWGEPGSVAGAFGVVSGIARDRHGRTFVADKNRGVVMVFDPDYRLLTEVGGDVSGAGSLGLPGDIAVDRAGRLYVTQIGRQGVFVYDVRPE